MKSLLNLDWSFLSKLVLTNLKHGKVCLSSPGAIAVSAIPVFKDPWNEKAKVTFKSQRKFKVEE